MLYIYIYTQGVVFIHFNLSGRKCQTIDAKGRNDRFRSLSEYDNKCCLPFLSQEEKKTNKKGTYILD